ncbi:hypothetical protein MES4922_10248 [Mesorhizobium ventifaucium]|uniref:Uncharacterized protein n=1 Tax=Mesorhizobium ventifaucium TaxID=666020 RepID=A0ABM9DCT2_9HYPH|nr:hypothetical protein MES4922_10248 [Mesorhizobium ventifaucium]
MGVVPRGIEELLQGHYHPGHGLKFLVDSVVDQLAHNWQAGRYVARLVKQKIRLSMPEPAIVWH